MNADQNANKARSPMTYRAPVRDLAFTLQAVAGIDQVAATGAFPD